MSVSRPLIRVTQIGEFIRHHSCERRFKLDHDGRQLTKALPFFFTLSGAMDPVLEEAGRQRERDWETCLRDAGMADLCRYKERPGEVSTSWEMFAGRCATLTPGQAAYGREIDVQGDLGGFDVAGRVDFVLVQWDGDKPLLCLVECKASRKDKTYQRVQLALYRLLTRRLLGNNALIVAGQTVSPNNIECVVARIEEASNLVQDILALPRLDLEVEEADVARLTAEDGPLAEILGRNLAAISYQLEAKCDDCALNVYCLPEAARERRIELLGVDAGTVRGLGAAGVTTIDALADLKTDGPEAARLRREAGFAVPLDVLVQKARARRSSLPGGDPEGKIQDVVPLPHAGNGQLPPHVTGAHQLVRVFLSVNFDYVENRVGAVAAHITRSDKPLSTLFQQEEGRWRPDPIVKEQWATGKDDAGRNVFDSRELQGEEIVGILTRPWSGEFDSDTQREGEMLGAFFGKIVAAIQTLCPEERAPVHFYVWSRSEITRLVEACARAETDLLGSLRQLLGCRESLEQLMYSCLSDEVDGRYALGWTSRGLAAATSLRWFGRRFHWTRRVGGEDVALDRVFNEGIFDFKTGLKFDGNGDWLPLEDAGGYKHAFEVRASFADALPAPYWRAHWGTLPDADEPSLSPKAREGIRKYQTAGRPGVLRAYLRARVQALRWIEEGVTFKNTEIAKPAIDVNALPTFSLGVDSAARAALDFLWLEQHVATNDWLSAHLVPPAHRAPGGRTLLLRDVRAEEDNKLIAGIDWDSHGLDKDALAGRCGLAEGSFVRLSPCGNDLLHGQTIAQLVRGGSTCIVERIDWDAGTVELTVMPFVGRGDRYILPSRGWPLDGAGFERATLDESLSDFVAGKIDGRLQSGLGAHVYNWFDPCGARIPAQTALSVPLRERYRALLGTLDLGNGPLAADQVGAALAGLNARVQLLQGPPGTGKTQTTAAATWLRILARRRPGDVILVAANTHTAVDTLLRRMAALQVRFTEGAKAAGLEMPPVRLAKIGSSLPTTPTGEGIDDVCGRGCEALIASEGPGAVLVLGGTPNALLKLAKTAGVTAQALVVDEASMMVLPYFLAVASLVAENGEILLAGDHRQLAPIVAHDWEREERPPVRVYEPYVSAYEAIRTLKQRQQLSDAEITQSALTYTFRLPPALRELVGRLYRLDGIALAGPPAPAFKAAVPPWDLWERVWEEPTGLFLATHDERESRQSNALEAQIIGDVLRAAGNLPAGSVGVVVPHRAQRTLLKEALAGFPAVDVIDTVERLQGGERQTIIVSATASDPAAIAARAEFLLGLNRANVAFSRAQQRLIVVCAESLIAHIPPSVEHYAEALLWKSLRAVCNIPLGSVAVGNHAVRVWTVRAGDE